MHHVRPARSGAADVTLQSAQIRLGAQHGLEFLVCLRRLRRLQTELSRAGLEPAYSYVSLTEVSEYAAGIPGEMREARGVPHQLYWYTVNGTTVWGATARILHQLLELAMKEL